MSFTESLKRECWQHPDLEVLCCRCAQNKNDGVTGCLKNPLVHEDKHNHSNVFPTTGFDLPLPVEGKVFSPVLKVINRMCLCLTATAWDFKLGPNVFPKSCCDKSNLKLRRRNKKKEFGLVYKNERKNLQITWSCRAKKKLIKLNKIESNFFLLFCKPFFLTVTSVFSWLRHSYHNTVWLKQKSTSCSHKPSPETQTSGAALTTAC